MPARQRTSLFACTRPMDTDFVPGRIKIIDVRSQLNEQLKCLESRLEVQVAMVTELQDFFRRLSEVETEYAKNLEKLVKNTKLRHRQEKQKREHWSLFSTFTTWQQVLDITKKESRDHQTLSDIYGNQMVQRFNSIIDNSQRIHRSCHEIGMECHEDIMKTLTELQNAMKTYHTYQTESKQAESKLRTVECQKNKLEQQLAGKNISSNKKLKSWIRQTEKKQNKYSENKLKALKSRNDYLLCIESANAGVSKYFADDISDLIDCMDFGYHNSVRCTMMMYQSCHKNISKTHQNAIEVIQKCVGDLDAQSDKQRFIELYNAAFMLPKKFDFQPCKGDEVQQISAQKPVQDDILQRYKAIGDRLVQLRLDNDETWKTMEATEKSLNDMITGRNYDVSSFFLEENPPPKSPHEAAKQRSEWLEMEGFYIHKFRKYTQSCNQISRLQGKYSVIQRALGDNISTSGRPPSLPPKPKKRRIGRSQLVGQPKLFGGSLEEYCDATGQEIPLVIKSCVRAINLYGMHHQGIFRVSGAQVEINEFRVEFEKGEDPLIDMDPSDINSVAGVLKLYFRELREPLFPLPLFDELISGSKLDDGQRVEKIKDLLSPLPRCVLVVMRYLFAFLNHLSEYSDENMMDPYNLAICFGPTLLPIPSDRDQVSYQGNVHEVIKTIIIHHEDIFTFEGGEVYEKCIVDDPDRESYNDITDIEVDPSSVTSDDEDDDGSSLDAQIFEAVALYDFEGRTERELSFKKHDTLLVYHRVSSDWWEGLYQGKEGLIPDRYINLKHPPEEKRSQPDEDGVSRSSTLSKASASKLPTILTEPDQPEKPPPQTTTNDSNPEKPSPHMTPSGTPRSSMADTDSTSVNVPAAQTNSSPKLEVKRRTDSLRIVEEEDVKDDLSADIDSALAEVVSGLRSLEMQQRTDKRMSLPTIKHTPKHTPDLVLDLPTEGANVSPQDLSEPDSPTTTADTFAQSNQGTLKKANSMPRNISGHFLEAEQGGSTFMTSPLLGSFAGKKRGGSAREGSSKDPPFSPLMSASMTSSLTSSEMSSSMTSSMTSSISVPPVLPPSGFTGHKQPPPVAEKPKLPPKVKPPVMKKPTRSPEVQRRQAGPQPAPLDSK
ncbi:SLIT-ROBO Rho GTPase-activating protein 1-like isoform X8 [Ostrea edulis]|uniref:SLIT-ROBO Rho GTPase-activating protein 1-like isoform X8 n=1 Tax=Ostrea edulis TaxID=37623 RepID=UPI0024AFB37C|nr:SLIT-ROBO Rho GTPase-activating protein 1-like isoform X8 [Ostrea edulis]